MKAPPFNARISKALGRLSPRLGAAVRDVIGPWPLTDFPTTDKGADLSRLLLDWVATTASPDWELRGVVRRLRARARELERNNSYAAGYLGMTAHNVIGPHGFDHQPQVRDANGDLDEAINEIIEDRWARWSEAPTIDGRMSLTDLQELELKTVARDGELFNREWTGTDFYCGYALEPIDCDLVDETLSRRSPAGPEIRMGIEVNDYGRPTGYHVTQAYGKYGSGAGDYAYLGSGGFNTMVIPASEMFQLARYRRVNQTRGVTWMGPTMIALRMLDGYEEAELVAARTAAAKMGFFQAKDREAGSFGPDDPNEAMTIDASPGVLEVLPKGWEFTGWDPQHPTSQFPSFVKMILRKVSTGLGVSYNSLASDLEGVNYSSMRSGLITERDTWRRLQNWWMGAFLQRVYRNWMAHAIAAGEIDRGRYTLDQVSAVKFQPRGYLWVDPKKDAEAGVIEIQTGLNSRTQLLGEQGVNFEDVLEELAREDAASKKAGLDISGPRRPPDSAGTGSEPDGIPAGEPGGELASKGTDPTSLLLREAMSKPEGRASLLAALRNGRNGHGR